MNRTDLLRIAARVGCGTSSPDELLKECVRNLDVLYGLVGRGLMPVEPVDRAAQEMRDAASKFTSLLHPIVRETEAMIAGAIAEGRLRA